MKSMIRSVAIGWAAGVVVGCAQEPSEVRVAENFWLAMAAKQHRGDERHD
jgi:hypothetical protein